jgi:hypothetical protein
MNINNQITFNEISEFDITNILEFNYIDTSGLTVPSDDKEVCFKLHVWNLQGKYGVLVQEYSDKLKFGQNDSALLEKLKLFRWGLQVLNRYNPRDIVPDTTDYNALSYKTVLKVMQKLYIY